MKKFLKQIENFNRRLLYSLLKIFFKNPKASIPLDKSQIKKILIFRYDVIGDMLVTTPVFDLIRKHLPDTELHVLASSKNSFLIKNDERIDKIYEWDKKYFSLFSLIQKMRKEKYDLILAMVLFRTTFSGLLANFIGKKKAVKVTVLHEKRKDLYSALFNVQVNLSEWRQKVTMAELQYRMICILFDLNFNNLDINLSLPIPEENLKTAIDYYSILSKKRNIILNISSRESFRKWSVENNKHLIEKIIKKYQDVRVIISSSPEDYDEAKSICPERSEQVTLFKPTQDMWDVFALIRYSDLVISPDTGIIHIASMFKKPVLGLYSSINNKDSDWDAFGVPFRKILSRNSTPLSTITVDEVFEAFCNLYQECFKS
ncbi:MAG: glycosyltransferase family 9 protein [FCB group bacterium]